MSDNDDAEFIEALRTAAEGERRGYADFFSWPDRSVAEWGIATTFAEAAPAEPGAPFGHIVPRGQGNDPPDCEAKDCHGRRIGIEITELVSQRAIEQVRRSGEPYSLLALWTRELFLAQIADLLAKKDAKTLKDPPYDEYIVLIHTAEMYLPAATVDGWLSGHRFPAPKQVSRAYLLLSYDAHVPGYPYFRLPW